MPALQQMIDGKFQHMDGNYTLEKKQEINLLATSPKKRATQT